MGNTARRGARSRRNGTAGSDAGAVSSSRGAARLAQGMGSLTTGQTLTMGLLLVFLVLTLAMPLRTYAQQRADLAETRENIARMEARVAELEADKEKYSDPAYIKEQARIRLGLVEEGETPFRLIDPQIGETTIDTVQPDVEIPNGNWYELLWKSISVMPEMPEPVNPGREEATKPDRLPTVPEETAIPEDAANGAGDNAGDTGAEGN
ncbi:FtsB family cell division protein [Corynebacterium sp. H78]|uniref:FtsB family cell division protein n=1 Tax=Corynebacterium sp. H78 TaxID=3133417 RepID=UPI0030AAC5A8